MVTWPLALLVAACIGIPLGAAAFALACFIVGRRSDDPDQAKRMMEEAQ